MKNFALAPQPCSPGAQCLAPVTIRTRLSPLYWLQKITDRLDRWHRLARERRQLQALSDHMLKDIGLTRADVEREASRPFWDDRDIRH